MIEATVKVRLKPWNVPNFASPEVATGRDQPEGIPVRSLDESSLSALVEQWIDDLYAKTDHHSPFVRSPMKWAEERPRNGSKPEGAKP